MPVRVPYATSGNDLNIDSSDCRSVSKADHAFRHRDSNGSLGWQRLELEL
jgi:hypothetical protein